MLLTFLWYRLFSIGSFGLCSRSCIRRGTSAIQDSVNENQNIAKIIDTQDPRYTKAVGNFFFFLETIILIEVALRYEL